MGFFLFFELFGLIGLSVFMVQFSRALELPLPVVFVLSVAVTRAFLSFSQSIFDRDNDDTKGPPLPPASV